VKKKVKNPKSQFVSGSEMAVLLL